MARPRGAKDKRPRRRRDELIKCPKCPPEHPGWHYTELRSRDKVQYCEEHVPEFKTHAKSPKCPDCGGDFDFFRWGGSPEQTTIHCSCGFSVPALDYYDALDIKVLASPIEVSTGV